MKWSEGAGYNKFLKHAHQYSMTKCCYWTFILRDALLRRKKDLVGCLVELKVMVSHSSEAEVIIPERNHHLQNTIFCSWSVSSSPIQGLICFCLCEWNVDQIISEYQWIILIIIVSHFSFLDQKTVSCSIVIPVAWVPEMSCYSSLSFFFILDVKWD